MHVVRVHCDPSCGSWWAEDGQGYVAVSDSLPGIEQLIHEGMSEFHGLDPDDVAIVRVEAPAEQQAR